MATNDRTEANLKSLQKTNEVQDKTMEALVRIQRQTAETEQIGSATLDELQRQGHQMDNMNDDVTSVSSKLEQSKILQGRFDRVAGNWLGGKKNEALREAAAEILEKNSKDYTQVKEVFEDEKFDSLSRIWRRAGLVLCSDPTVSCDSVFDPALQATLDRSSWSVDFSLQNIDREGWTYAYDFATLNKNGMGDKASHWGSFVRRRKWRYVDQKGIGGPAVDEVIQRNEERKSKASALKQQEKTGYAPRNQQPVASGLSATGMNGRGKESFHDLDEQSAAGLKKVRERDAAITAGVSAIDKNLDNLLSIAGTMKDESLVQNYKLDKLDNNLQTTMEKQTVVNARQRHLLKD